MPGNFPEMCLEFFITFYCSILSSGTSWSFILSFLKPVAKLPAFAFLDNISRKHFHLSKQLLTELPPWCWLSFPHIMGKGSTRQLQVKKEWYTALLRQTSEQDFQAAAHIIEQFCRFCIETSTAFSPYPSVTFTTCKSGAEAGDVHKLADTATQEKPLSPHKNATYLHPIGS